MNDAAINIKDKIKVMVIDDSEFSRKSVVNTLEKHGLNVVAEADGPEKAIEILPTADANFYIIDVVMPKMNGIELARQINENFSKSHIIIISSLGQEHIIVEAIGAGAADFLQKPFSEDQLLDSIEKIFEIALEEGTL